MQGVDDDVGVVLALQPSSELLGEQEVDQLRGAVNPGRLPKKTENVRTVLDPWFLFGGLHGLLKTKRWFNSIFFTRTCQSVIGLCRLRRYGLNGFAALSMYDRYSLLSWLRSWQAINACIMTTHLIELFRIEIVQLDVSPPVSDT